MTATTKPTLDRKTVKNGHFRNDMLEVLTCSSFGQQPFETIVRHPLYKNGNAIVVAAYATQDEAEEGHATWLKLMQDGPLPKTLEDIGNIVPVSKGGEGQRLAASITYSQRSSSAEQRRREEREED